MQTEGGKVNASSNAGTDESEAKSMEISVQIVGRTLHHSKFDIRHSTFVFFRNKLALILVGGAAAVRYYPIFLDIRNRSCLVVGGGGVGCRKAVTLLECGARVVVVAPEVDRELRELAARGAIELRRRTYRASDLEGMFLVIGATDDQPVNLQIKRDADRQGKLCNIADRPEACHFILPAVVQRGDLVVAVSTSGKSPAFAKKVRQELTRTLGPEYAECLELLGSVRLKLVSENRAPEAHKELFERLIDRGLIRLMKKRDLKAVDAILSETFGSGYGLDDLQQFSLK